MNADIYSKAQILADALAESSELHNLRETESAMLADEEAQKIIGDFQAMQGRLSEAQQSGIEIAEEDKKIVAEIEESVQSHPLISAYLAAQDQFTEMLDSVNSILANAIAQGDQAGGCATCGSSECSSCHTAEF